MDNTSSLQKDIDDIQSINIVPTILDVICRSTGMGFAAIARVTEEKWITCGVLDTVPLGLSVGDELEINDTFCKQVRESNRLVIMDHAAKDKVYCHHKIPKMYGFQSYISVPILRKNGEFFGTLCALDPKPNKVNNPQVIAMFTMFCEMLAFHLDAIDTMQKQGQALKRKESELATYDFISSHDLQEPLRKIQILSSAIENNEAPNLSDAGKKYFSSIKNAATRMRTILNDLLSYSETSFNSNRFKEVELSALVKRSKSRLAKQFEHTKTRWGMDDLCQLNVVPIQIEQLFYNMFSNCINFKSPERDLHIQLNTSKNLGSAFNVHGLQSNVMYCEITVKDNGIGFEQQYADRMFQLFKRLSTDEHNKGTGIGLAIVKRIVENHQGQIVAIGKPNHYAIFKMYFPVSE